MPLTTHDPVASGARIVIAAMGTRGDIQPLCVLGRHLSARGHDVAIWVNADYRGLVARFGLTCVGSDVAFYDLLRDPATDAVLHDYFHLGVRAVPALLRFARRLQDRVADAMVDCARAIAGADLVVYNPFTFFAGDMARERSIASLRVTAQPLRPTRHRALCLLGDRDWGAFANRASYEIPRLLSPLLRRSYASLRRRTGCGRNLGPLVNPVTLGLGGSPDLMAFSAHVAPPAADWTPDFEVTGFWFDEPGDAVLPDEIRAFLNAGPPPVHVGFGSMLWGAARNTELVREALARWGGRAILSAGAGGLRPDLIASPDVLVAGGVDHDLLFPHLAAAVHHGGAGTTAAALRHGLPNVILPVLGDQLYWGHRVAALGACETPVPLARIGAEDLAGRIARACGDPNLREGATAAARAIAAEPGIAAGVAAVERILSARRAAA